MLVNCKGYRYDIALLRILCIVVVVFFHGYGMMYANHFPTDVAELYRQQYELINQYGLINWAMPMFVFISGFLFGRQLKRKPLSLVKVIKDKFVRLMVPFFVFTIFFMLTTNSLSWEPFYRWTYWHLWFLPMLFWCFIVTYLIHPLIMNNRAWVAILTLLVLFAISLVGKVVPMIIGVHNVHLWICWFAFGTWFCSHEHLITKGFSRNPVAICGISIYVIVSYLVPWEYGSNNLMGTIATLGGILALWSMANMITWSDSMWTKFVITLSGASFGIYIFHNWVEMFMISRTAQRLIPLDYWAIEHTTLFPLLFSLMAFIISWGLTWLLLKTRFGKFLIG